MNRYKPFECDTKSVVNEIKDAIETRSIKGVQSLYLTEIDAAKVAKCTQMKKIKFIAGEK